MDIRDYDDAALVRELERRENLKVTAQKAALLKQREEEKRIYNLPENVAKRQEEQDKANYKTVLHKVALSNAGLTEATEGIWSIYGEDSNCDMGGPHHEPFLGKVKGTLKQAIQWAIKHPRFFEWGGGGRVELSELEKVIEL